VFLYDIPKSLQSLQEKMAEACGQGVLPVIASELASWLVNFISALGFGKDSPLGKSLVESLAISSSSA
jgi:hypothetical protein